MFSYYRKNSKKKKKTEKDKKAKRTKQNKNDKDESRIMIKRLALLYIFFKICDTVPFLVKKGCFFFRSF